MSLNLALLEAGWIFAAVCAAAAWAHPLPASWIDVATVLSRAVAFSLCCVLALYYAELYDLRTARSFASFLSRLPRSLLLAAILVAVMYVAWPSRERSWSVGPWGLLLLGVLLPERAIAYRVLRSRPFRARVLIVGTSPLAHQLIREMQAQPHLGYAVVGVADDPPARDVAPARYPLLGPLAQLGKIIEEVRPDRIVVALAEREGQLPVAELLESLGRRIVIEDAAEVYERLTGKLAIEALSPSDIIFCQSFRKTRLALALARGISLVASVVAIVCLAPLLGLIALAIRLDSRGPVFFIQERMGAAGKPFKLIKFRTMHPAAQETSLWARDNADRITRVGKWLRRFRLDELPQFVNVLRGQMNLVGPRPHPLANFKLFAEHIPYYALRAMVPPGVTGWAQVRYRYANTLEEETEKMRWDLYYIKHMSIWLDLRILLDTVKIVFSYRGRGAADANRLETRERLRAA